MNERYEAIENERLATVDAVYKLIGKLRETRNREYEQKWSRFLYDAEIDLGRLIESLDWIRKGLEQREYECDLNKETSHDGV